MRKATEEKFLENAEKTINRNIRAGSMLPYAWTGNDGYNYFTVRNCGVVRTEFSLPEYLRYDRWSERMEMPEKFFGEVEECLESRIFNPDIPSVTINRTELKSRISAAKNGKRSAHTEIVLDGCVVNADLLLEVMTLCDTNEIYFIWIPKGFGSDILMAVPYVMSDILYGDLPKAEAFLFPIMGRNIEEKRLFDTYVYECT